MIIFDTETTGLMEGTMVPLKRQPRIIEFAAVRLDDKTLNETASWDFLIDPGVDISPKITEITNITPEMPKGQKPFAFIYPILANEVFLGERIVAGHNLDFDTSLLECELKRIGCHTAFPWPPVRFCTVEQSYKIQGHRLKLADLYEIATGGGKIEGAHRALNDVRATAFSFRYLVEKGHINLP